MSDLPKAKREKIAKLTAERIISVWGVTDDELVDLIARSVQGRIKADMSGDFPTLSMPAEAIWDDEVRAIVDEAVLKTLLEPHEENPTLHAMGFYPPFSDRLRGELVDARNRLIALVRHRDFSLRRCLDRTDSTLDWLRRCVVLAPRLKEAVARISPRELRRIEGMARDGREDGSESWHDAVELLLRSVPKSLEGVLVAPDDEAVYDWLSDRAERRRRMRRGSDATRPLSELAASPPAAALYALLTRVWSRSDRFLSPGLLKQAEASGIRELADGMTTPGFAELLVALLSPRDRQGKQTSHSMNEACAATGLQKAAALRIVADAKHELQHDYFASAHNASIFNELFSELEAIGDAYQERQWSELLAAGDLDPDSLSLDRQRVWYLMALANLPERHQVKRAAAFPVRAARILRDELEVPAQDIARILQSSPATTMRWLKAGEKYASHVEQEFVDRLHWCVLHDPLEGAAQGDDGGVDVDQRVLLATLLVLTAELSSERGPAVGDPKAFATVWWWARRLYPDVQDADLRKTLAACHARLAALSDQSATHLGRETMDRFNELQYDLLHAADEAPFRLHVLSHYARHNRVELNEPRLVETSNLQWGGGNA
ncbi:MAG: hypothetical protein KDA61_02435 [Planctomycetales bacterium]|nr:hypothetical protein [Planctomycetales bacterium]